MFRKLPFLIAMGLMIVTGLLVCGLWGMKTLRISRLRHAAMTAYENKDYASAERLLLQYVRKDPDAESGFVALANVYHEFGNMGMESQMWQTASSLNQQDPEYRANMLRSIVQSADYALLHGVLGRKAKVDETFTDQELYLYVISSYRSGYPQDGDDAYKKNVELDPEVFHKNELGRMAEFMATYESLSDGKRDLFLNSAMQSEDPAIRFEAIYTALSRLEQSDDDDPERIGEIEKLLNQAVEVNYFVGTALLADFYFSRKRFAETVDVLKPYLKTIDDIDLYLLYAESCAFTGNRDELVELEKKTRRKADSMLLVADYCENLIAYLDNDEEKLVVSVRKSGKRIDSPLARFIRLRVAMANESSSEILTVVQEFFSNPPFYDLHNRALLICLDYIVKEMKKPEDRKDNSLIVDMARILSWYLHGNRLLTEIVFTDMYKTGQMREEYLTAVLEQFPDDALLLRLTAEFLILNEKAEQALPIIEQVLEDEKTKDRPFDRGIQILSMLALDQIGQHEEAAAAFRELVVRSGFDRDLLGSYFLFCVNNKRMADLISMAEKLDSMEDGDMKRFSGFFRAAAMLPSGDKSKEKEALDLLAATPTDDPVFTFFAANSLYKYDRLDEAEEKYKAILTTYRTPALPYVNLSDIYHAKGAEQQAMEAAKAAFDLGTESMLPAFVYAKRLSEANRYEEAVNVLKFPRHAVNYRKDIVDLWCDCMKYVVEKSFADRKFLQAEEQCKHMLMIDPDNEFAKENLEKVLKILFPDEDRT